MDKKILLLLVIGVLTLLPLVNSQEVYEAGTIVDLKIPCFNNNTYCSSVATCNLTIIDFSGVVLVNNLQMDYHPSYFNYTLNTTQTANSGEYRIGVICNDNGNFGSSSLSYIITPTGKAITTSSAIIQGLILIMMFGVTIFFLIFSSTTEVMGVKLFFNLISYITMFLTVATGYILLRSSEVQGSLSFTVNALLYVVGIVLIVIMFYVMINQTTRALELMRIKKGFGSEYDNPQLF